MIINSKILYIIGVHLRMRDYTRLEIVEIKSLRGCDSLIITGTTGLSYWLRRCVV